MARKLYGIRSVSSDTPGTIELHRMIQRPRQPATGLSAWRGHVIDACVLAVLGVVVAASAVVTKELLARGGSPSLVALTGDTPDPAVPSCRPLELVISDPLAEIPEAGEPQDSGTSQAPAAAPTPELIDDLSIRYFNGRPVRPVRTVWMTVTAYSPDERSCGDSADNITSSLHHVETNAHRLVAADTRILPLGSMITVPGYDDSRVVPVLDRGGKIKGMRLDVLFPTHEQARRWGVRRLAVTVWDYADGNGKEDWRRLRDSK